MKRARPAPVEDDEAFPRGGGETLTPLERKQVEAEARAEFEQELASGKQPKAKKSKREQKVRADGGWMLKEQQFALNLPRLGERSIPWEGRSSLLELGTHLRSMPMHQSLSGASAVQLYTGSQGVQPFQFYRQLVAC